MKLFNFNSFAFSIHFPRSIAILQSTAQQFAGNRGVVIQLIPKYNSVLDHIKCINPSLVSQEYNQEMRLLFGHHGAVQIADIILAKNKSLKQYIAALSYLEKILSQTIFDINFFNAKHLYDKSQDEIFLEDLVSNINLRLEDANFKLEELAESLNMSYSRLYRKCKSLTGSSLLDFVRLLRLNKAAILITKYGFNISEAAFKTGFNDPKYFSKCFKKHFKLTPGDFKKEAQKTNISLYLKKYSIDDLDH